MGREDEHDDQERQRRTERLAVDEATRLRPNSWSSLEVRILDFSNLGLRARCEARIMPGSCVSVDVPGVGSTEAQVEWQRGDQFGARFLAPINLDRCQWTLRRRETILARLLVERAAARKAGRAGAETRLRRQIAAALPMRKGSASA
jgi:hypothetical protein